MPQIRVLVVVLHDTEAENFCRTKVQGSVELQFAADRRNFLLGLCPDVAATVHDPINRWNAHTRQRGNIGEMDLPWLPCSF